LVSLLLIWSASSACSGPQEKADEQLAETDISQPEHMPGAGGWSGMALELPANSPVVVEARLNELVAGVRDLKDWVTAEPRMLGENGEEMIQRINLYWSIASSYLGADPADPQAWRAQGLDIERRLYVGVYAISEPTESYVASVKKSLREQLSVDDDAALLKALKERAQKGTIPVGLNASVRRAVEDLEPDAGLRVLVPTTDASALLELLNNLATGAGYLQIPNAREQLPLGIIGRAYVHADGELPAFTARLGMDHVVLDLVWPPPAQGAPGSPDGPNQRAIEALRRAVEEIGPGRPAAPAPKGDPSLTLAFDQSGASTLVAARGFKRTMEFLDLVDTSKRDQILTLGMIDALANSRAWSTRARELSGLSYSLNTPGAETGGEAVSMDMVIYGSPLEKPLAVAPMKRSLELARRSGAAAVDLDPFFARSWMSWLRLDAPAETLDMLDASEADPLFHLLALPRNLALLVGNLAQHQPATFDASTAAVLEILPHVRRFEFATVGAAAANFARRPTFVSLVTLRKGDSPSEKQAAASGALNFAHGLALGFRDVEGDEAIAGAVTPDATITLDSYGRPFMYHYMPGGDEPFILIGSGLEATDFEKELSDVLEGKARSVPVGYFRLEPVSIVALLAGEENAIEPIDPAILAQRLGTITASVDPEEGKDTQMLRFRLELSRPAEL